MKKNLILSDLDGTILKTSLVLSHARYLIENYVINNDGSLEYWLADTKNEKAITSLAEHYRSEILNMNIEDLRVEEFINEFLLDDSNINNKVFTRIKKLHKKGYIVYLVTGSSDFLVKEIAKHFNFMYFASVYKTNEYGRLTGEVVGMFNEQQKSDKIKECFNLSSYNKILGFGDTFSDNGIFKHCHENYLVEPTKETLEKFLQSETNIKKIL